MENQWNDDQLTRLIRGARKSEAPPVSFDHVWSRIESAIEEKDKHKWHPIVWRPWNHPVRWVMAALVCAVFLGAFQQRDSADQLDLAAYLMSTDKPADEILAGDEIIQASALISAPSSSAGAGSLFDDDDDDDVYSDNVGSIL